MKDTQTIDIKIENERKKLEDFGNEADDYLQKLSDKLHKDFNSNLDKLVNQDLARFQQQVISTLASAGMAALAPQIASSLGGGALGNIATNALSAVLGNLASGGQFDLGSIANAAASGATGSSKRKNTFRPSAGQVANQTLRNVKRGERNS